MPKPSKRSLLKQFLSLLFGGFLIALLFYLGNFSWQEVVERISVLKITDLIIVGIAYGLVTLVFYYFCALKWKWVINGMANIPRKVPFGNLYYYVAMSYLTAVFLPSMVGVAGARGFLLKWSSDIPLKVGAYSVLLSLFINMMIASLFVFPAIVFLLKLTTLNQSMMLCGMFIGVFGVIFWRYNRYVISFCAYAYFLLIRIIYRLPYWSQKSTFDLDLDGFHIKSEIARKVIIYGLIRHLVIIIRVYLVALILGVDLSYSHLLLANSIMLFIGMISFIPGDVGIDDWGWYGVLLLTGIPETDIVAFIIVNRIFSESSLILLSGSIWLIAQNFPNRVRPRKNF